MKRWHDEPAPDLALASRFLMPQMWWIASEMVRRHPHLLLTIDVDLPAPSPGLDECEPGGPLIVHDRSDAFRVQFALADGVLFKSGGQIHTLTWAQVFAAQGPLDIVGQLEQALHLDSPDLTPPATPRTLVYRVIASALTTALSDPHDWRAVPAPISVADVPGSPGGPLFTGFSSTAVPRGRYASTRQKVGARGQSTLFRQPFWALLRDDQPIAIFDTAGIVHTVLGSTELLPFYTANDRELALITARILGPYLP